MISYNDVIEISRLYSQKEFDTLFTYINKKSSSNNIINFLLFCKNNRYKDKNDSIKLTANKKELIVFKDNFLKNLPIYEEKKYKKDEFIITLGYPDSNSLLKASCIKNIEYNNTSLDFTTTDIPLFLFKKCEKEIDYFFNKLKNTYTYYVNKKYNSRFSYNKAIIINIVYLCFVQNYESLLQEQLTLMRDYNFTYQDFNEISINTINTYLKLINKEISREKANV